RAARRAPRCGAAPTRVRHATRRRPARRAARRPRRPPGGPPHPPHPPHPRTAGTGRRGRRMTPTTTAAVLGTGGWGTTFAAVLADAGNAVTLWGRSART